MPAVRPKDKPRKQRKDATALSHKGKPVPPQFISSMWKPSQSGNPSGRNLKPKSLMDYLNDYYRGKIGPPGEEIERMEAQAKLLGGLALGVVEERTPGLRRDALRMVVDRLAPIKETQFEPFVSLHLHATDTGKAFVAALSEDMGMIGAVTPGRVLAVLQQRNGNFLENGGSPPVANRE